MILKKLPKFTFFETFDQKSTSKLQKLTASVLYCSLKPPGYILDLITYLFTNLFCDDSVIYSLMFCYIRYYTNIKNLEFSNSRMISSTRLSMIFARHFSLSMAPERHARTLTESAEDSLSRDLHLIIITNWESRRALEL